MAQAEMLEMRASPQTTAAALPLERVTEVAVTVAPVQEQDRLVRTITRAFAADPVARWFYPDPRQYHEHFPGLVRIMGAGAFAGGSAYSVEEGAGAALWLAPGAGPDEERLAEHIERSVGEDRRGRIFELFAEMDRNHPAEPHWYLPLIGVDPLWQGQGLGSALLRHMTERLDREGQIAYLESSNPVNLPLYRRFGFKPVGLIQAGGAPVMVSMLRRPR